MDSQVIRQRAAGLPLPAEAPGATAPASQSGGGPAQPPVDRKEVSAKLNAFFEDADPADQGAINLARSHIIDRVLAGESSVTVDLPGQLMDGLRALQIGGLTISSPPSAVVPGDYPPPQPVVNIPEMKMPPPRAPVVRQPQRERGAAEKKISAQIEKLGQGMPGYGGQDRGAVIQLTCAAIANQIARTPDQQARQDLQLEMAGALLQMVNADPKRTSLVNRMFELHLPSLASLNAPELDAQIKQRIDRLQHIPLDDLPAYGASLKRECRSIIDTSASVGNAGDRIMLMIKLVNMLVQVFREKQKPEDYDQCRYLHGVITEIIDGAPGSPGGLRKAAEDLPAEGRILAGHKAELLSHITREAVSLHFLARHPDPQPAEAERVCSPQELASLKASGLIY